METLIGSSTLNWPDLYCTKDNGDNLAALKKIRGNLPDVIAYANSRDDEDPKEDQNDKKQPDLLRNPSTPELLAMRGFAQADEDRPKLIKRVGSIRGRKNAVKDAIGLLAVQKNWSRNYATEDAQKVVLYMTSLRVVRKTWEKCRNAVMILEQNLIKFDRRDLNMTKSFIEEYKNRSGLASIQLPLIYINGHLFGDDTRLERYNETGDLKTIVKPFISPVGVRPLCEKCYGFRFLPCLSCGGGKRSNLTYTSPDSSLLTFRCVKCDASGLIMCEECTDGFQTGGIGKL